MNLINYLQEDNLVKPSISEADLKLYLGNISKYDNEIDVYTSGLEDSVELAEYIVRDIDIVLAESIGVGVESSDDEEERPGFVKKIGIIIKIIVKLIQVALRVLGIVGVSVIGLIRGKVNAYVDAGEKMLDKIEEHMKKENISDTGCPHGMGKESDPHLDYMTAYFYNETGNYKSAIMQTLKEIQYFREYEKIVNKMADRLEALDFRKDFEKIAENKKQHGKLTDAILPIIKKYYQNLPLALVADDPSPLTKSIAKSAEFKHWFSTHNASSVIGILPYGGEYTTVDGKPQIEYKFQGLLQTNKCETLFDAIVNPLGHNKVSKGSECYSFVLGSVVIKLNPDIKVPILPLKELREINNTVKGIAEDADKLSSRLKKVDKALRKKIRELDELKDEIESIGGGEIISNLLHSISNNTKSYISAVRTITSYAGQDLTKSIPIYILISNILLKAQCTGTVDLAQLERELEAELKKLEKKYGKKV